MLNLTMSSEAVAIGFGVGNRAILTASPRIGKVGGELEEKRG